MYRAIITHIPLIAALLGYLVGLVISVVLLIRTKGTAAILATVGFAVLMLVSIGQIVFTIRAVTDQFVRTAWLEGVSHCCCGLFNIAAIVCLAIALWQAVSGPKKPAAGESSIESV